MLMSHFPLPSIPSPFPAESSPTALSRLYPRLLCSLRSRTTVAAHSELLVYARLLSFPIPDSTHSPSNKPS